MALGREIEQVAAPRGDVVRTTCERQRVHFHTGLGHVVGLILVIGLAFLLLVVVFTGFGNTTGSLSATGLEVVF